MTSNLFGIGLSGLNAAMWGMNATGQNISNQVTPGYTRVIPEYSEASGYYTPSGYMPQGVTTTSVKRVYSEFLTNELHRAQGKGSSLAAYYSMISELSNLIGRPTEGIGKAITDSLNAFQGVANDPSSLAARQSQISKAQMLADQLHTASEQYTRLRSSTNEQIGGVVSDANAYAKQIAELNAEIKKASSSGQPPNDLLDKRDLAVANLSQLVGGQVVNNAEGVSVFLPGGQPLVNGSSSYELGAVPSPSDPTELSVAWLGRSGANPRPEPVGLADSSITEGALGGLLRFRRETLDPAEAELGAIAVSYAEQVNRQNALGIDLNGRQGGDLFKFGAPSVFANARNSGSAQLSAKFEDATKAPMGDYTLSFDGTSYALADRATGNVVGTATELPATIAGLKFELTGPMAAGDSFSVFPTRGALSSFELATTDGSAIAAASPVLSSNATSNTGSASLAAEVTGPNFSLPAEPVKLSFHASPAPGQLTGFPVGSTVTIDGKPPTTIQITSEDTPVPYDPSSGTTLNVSGSNPSGLNDVRLHLSGKPNDGDTFTIQKNTGVSGDGSNALAMGKLMSSHAFNDGATLTNAYASYVNRIGNTTTEIKVSAQTQNSTVMQISNAQQSVSGVNADEEAANLLYYQRLYQANSKVIMVAADMFDTVLGMLK